MTLKKKTFQILLFIIASLCISTALLPYLLLSTGPIGNEETPSTLVNLRVSSRKALDLGRHEKERRRKGRGEEEGNSEEEITSHIEELKRITVSVRNELRELEQQRVKIVQETEHYKSNLFRLQENIANAKKQLVLTQSELAKISHEIYSVKNNGHAPNVITRQAPPIYILPNAPIYETRPHPFPSTFQCDQSNCLNYTSCSPNTGTFKVYIYHEITQKISKLIEYLKSINSYTDTPIDACLIVLFYDGISSLPAFQENSNNYLIISLNSDHTPQLISPRVTRLQLLPTSDWRHGHDIIAPPITDVSSPIWKNLPPIVPGFRKYLLYFEGHRHGNGGINNWLHKLRDVLNINSSTFIHTTCTGEPVGVASGWSLCGSTHSRSLNLRQSTFSLILTENVTFDYVRLSEALQYGAIPVIVGRIELPFESILDWSEITIQLPYALLHEIHIYIRRISHDQLLEMKRLGRFIWETYFSSSLQIIKTSLAIMRFRLLHLPPVANDVIAKRFKRFGGESMHKSPIFIQNSSIYGHHFWNSPPGPFFMYPSSPLATPPPISGSHYSTLNKIELNSLPPHILQAGGITGPYFQNYLLGNSPEEYFTIVMLTYRREEVVKESIERLKDLDHLDKVILVWNDPESSPFSMDWPTLHVPLEIVWAEANSLNNRFLPFQSIETEAILSIDDDVYLRHDEIQFAFRVWRESRDRLVGFPGRFHSYDVKHGSWLYNSNYTCELSMVLTGAAFFHKYYSYLYTLWQPQAVRSMVDQKMNCEDIAMNFLVAHITRKPPLKVTSRWTFKCPSCPDTLSQNDAHFDERHNCINYLTKIYGYIPLLYTQYRLDSVLFKTRLPSHLEKCYQYV